MTNLYGYDEPLNNRVARIHKDYHIKKCSHMSDMAGQDVVCPYNTVRPYNGSGYTCPKFCDITSRRSCINCSYLVRYSDGNPYCLMQHGQGCITGTGINCPNWVMRNDKEEDAGEYIERRIIEMDGQFTEYGELESQATRELRMKARQEWIDAHEQLEWHYTEHYKEQYLPCQHVSKEDALMVGELMQKAVGNTDWHEPYEIKNFVTYAMNIAEHLEEHKK